MVCSTHAKPRVKSPTSAAYQSTHDRIRAAKLTTVCEEAACPNVGECWAKKHAAIMVLGDTCTRACGYCNIKTGKPNTVDVGEPERVGAWVAEVGLKHVVVTAVTRDDLPDGGADHFVQTIQAIRKASPGTSVEVLVPDFLNKPGAIAQVVRAKPDVLNHNVETVPRLYLTVRPGGRYFQALWLLRQAKALDPTLVTKTGLMVGLGEEDLEIYQVMDDLRCAGVDALTIGQYLQPTPAHLPVQRYVTEETFARYARMARGKGFAMVSASALTRSSYHADEDFERVRLAKSVV